MGQLRKRYETELKKIKQEIIAMCALVEQQIADCTAAIINKDEALIAKVRETEILVDKTEDFIESKCYFFLLREQPVAQDLRDIFVGIKIIAELERIGDQADDIAAVFSVIDSSEQLNRLNFIPQMGKIASQMVRGCVDAYIKNDIEKALAIIEKDNEMDTLYFAAQNNLKDFIIENAEQNTQQALLMLMIIKYYERIGDHAVNICEWVHYAATGINPRHAKKYSNNIQQG
ncbi:MAG: phosphate signaling complex protein PhoU [Firmicutes bacterium]|nr:phosphate signaling complex protein PhoU [Bacillota bacterium]